MKLKPATADFGIKVLQIVSVEPRREEKTHARGGGGFIFFEQNN